MNYLGKLYSPFYYYGSSDSYFNAFLKISKFVGVDIEDVVVISNESELVYIGSGTIFLGFGGKKLNEFLSVFKKEEVKFVSFFPGIVYLDAFLSCYSRANCDLVILPNLHSEKLFNSVKRRFGFKCSSLVVPYLIDLSPKPIGKEKNISLFIEQSIVPYSYKERLQLVKDLLFFAQLYKNRTLIILLREFQNSPHHTVYKFEDIIEDNNITVPDNVSIKYGKASEVIDQCDHVISATSTVIFDAVYKDKYVSIYPLNNPEVYGQDVFIESKVVSHDLSCFNKVDRNSPWFKEHILNGHVFLNLEWHLNTNYGFEFSLSNAISILRCNYNLHPRVDVTLLKSLFRSYKYSLLYRKFYRRNK